MTSNDDRLPSNSDASNRNEKSNSEVGYKHPPAAHQFQKGMSGNPAGRPKRNDSAPNHNYCKFRSIVLEEGFRKLDVLENGKRGKVPAIQAVMRRLALAAVGNNKLGEQAKLNAQLRFAELVRAAEQSKLDEIITLTGNVDAYMERCKATAAEYRRRGLPPPEFVPHPDEMVIDPDTGELYVNGPESERIKAIWDLLMKEAANDKLEIAKLRKQAKRPGANTKHLEWLIDLKQKLVDMAEGSFPDEETRRQPGFDIREWRKRQKKKYALIKQFLASEKANRNRKS